MCTAMGITVVVKDGGGGSEGDGGDTHGDGFPGDEDLSIHYWSKKREGKLMRIAKSTRNFKSQDMIKKICHKLILVRASFTN